MDPQQLGYQIGLDRQALADEMKRKSLMRQIDKLSQTRPEIFNGMMGGGGSMGGGGGNTRAPGWSSVGDSGTSGGTGVGFQVEDIDRDADKMKRMAMIQQGNAMAMQNQRDEYERAALRRGDAMADQQFRDARIASIGEGGRDDMGTALAAKFPGVASSKSDSKGESKIQAALQKMLAAQEYANRVKEDPSLDPAPAQAALAKATADYHAAETMHGKPEMQDNKSVPYVSDVPPTDQEIAFGGNTKDALAEKARRDAKYRSPAAAAEPVAAAPVAETKVVNGVVFRKVPGGWEEVIE